MHLCVSIPLYLPGSSPGGQNGPAVACALLASNWLQVTICARTLGSCNFKEGNSKMSGCPRIALCETQKVVAHFLFGEEDPSIVVCVIVCLCLSMSVFVSVCVYDIHM